MAFYSNLSLFLSNLSSLVYNPFSLPSIETKFIIIIIIIIIINY